MHPNLYIAVKRRISELNARKSIQKNRWIVGFENTKSIFIHIPKAAGTSISSALYGEDPWHHPAREYLPLGRKTLNQFFKFAFIRNPYERILSTYHYSFQQVQQTPRTSVAFVTKYPTFGDFVMDWINEENIRRHYFFLPQYDYISDPNTDRILVDFIGRLETIAEDFEFVKRKLGVSTQLPIENKSSGNRDLAQSYTTEVAAKVASAYSKDFEVFHYPVEIRGLTSA